MPSYPDDPSKWDAVIARLPDADSAFVYAVKSTGIYCRPTCPSRRPKRTNVSYFNTPSDATAAGFRPCLRCQPNEVSSQQRAVAEAKHYLDTADPMPTLTQLGTAIGLSPFHLQRLFKRVTGLTPKQYAAAQRAERLKAELRQGATVTSALYEAGYGSTRALYDTAHKHLGMSPGAYKQGGQGVTIQYTLRDTPVGRMLLAATAKGICALRFGDDEQLVAELRAEFPRAVIAQAQDRLDPMVQGICSHLSGMQQQIDLPLDVQATEFQQRVWRLLRSIPYGETRSYQEVATMIGEPTAVRAVARACATNPVAIVIPCHRVVRASGGLSGYRWGVDRKRKLLEQESAE